MQYVANIIRMYSMVWYFHLLHNNPYVICSELIRVGLCMKRTSEVKGFVTTLDGMSVQPVVMERRGCDIV